MEVTIRQMREEDCLEVSRVVCDSFQWGAQHEGLTAKQVRDYLIRRGSEDAIRDQFGQYGWLVACSDATVVGAVATKENEITKLYVDPRFVRKGIGAALFRAAERVVRQAGQRDVVLGTVFDSSIPFYETMGMSKVGRRSVVYGPVEGADSMIMKKSLLPDEGAEPNAAEDADKPRR